VEIKLEGKGFELPGALKFIRFSPVLMTMLMISAGEEI
jgi:hypothetical protein